MKQIDNRTKIIAQTEGAYKRNRWFLKCVQKINILVVVILSFVEEQMFIIMVFVSLSFHSI